MPQTLTLTSIKEPEMENCIQSEKHPAPRQRGIKSLQTKVERNWREILSMHEFVPVLPCVNLYGDLAFSQMGFVHRIDARMYI